MGVKKPDSLELVTENGDSCDVIKHKISVLNDPIKIRYIMDITRFEDGDFDIDFSFRNEDKLKHSHEITESVHLMDSKAKMKGGFTNKQINSDQFLKNLLRDFFSTHFNVHPLDLLIRVNYEENNYPETVFVTFNVERNALINNLAIIDNSMYCYLTMKCLI